MRTAFPSPILGRPLNARSMSALVCNRQSATERLNPLILADLPAPIVIGEWRIRDSSLVD